MNCCVFSNDYNDGPSCYTESLVRAKKAHECCECDRDIPAGEQYQRATGVWEGHGRTYKTCLACVDIREHFSNACRNPDEIEGREYDSYGGRWAFQCLYNDLAENFFPDMTAGGPCMAGMSPRAKAKMFEMYLEWYEQDEHDGARPPRPYTPNEGSPPP